MVPDYLQLVKPLRQKMKVPADRIRDRLGFVVVIHAGQVAPAIVPAQFDQARADHDSKSQPAKKPEHQNRWTRFWKRTRIEQWAKKNRQKTRLQKLNLPSITVPNVTDMDDGHVNDPEKCEQDRVRVTGQHNQRQPKTDPGEDPQS